MSVDSAEYRKNIYERWGMIGLLGGTSLVDAGLFQDAERRRVFTPYGSCVLNMAGETAFVPRQGERGELPPHRINHHAHLHALRNLGVQGIVSFASTGSLKESLPPGTLLLIGDYFAPFRVMTFYHDRLRFTIPRVSPEWSETVRRTLDAVGITPHAGVVYAETSGPRFETEAEVRWLATVADVAGMTCASEAFLAGELGIPHCTIATVDNYAHGIGLEPLSDVLFHEQVRKNRAMVRKVVTAIMTSLR